MRLGLNVPAISWTTARDTLAEWFNLLALIASTGDKIGHEIYNLQRPEIDEVSEGFVTLRTPRHRHGRAYARANRLANHLRLQGSHMDDGSKAPSREIGRNRASPGRWTTGRRRW